MDNHTVLVFEDLLYEWDKICNNIYMIGKYSSWLYYQSYSGLLLTDS